MGGLEKQQRVTLRLDFRLWAPSLRQREVRAQALRCEAEYRVLRLPYRIRPQLYPTQRLQVVTGLQWARAEGSSGVPVWVVVLAVLLGLLLLALLCYGLYKLGFFKRSVPYGTAMEKLRDVYMWNRLGEWYP
ncbi:integrin alpha-5-like [Phalacrocorax aristotelis]|uniref:integrin alpha-5-like n=1 Tax=Phalacrocorax aristotelis TaxID=126867 RepID=UPI003F4C1FDD